MIFLDTDRLLLRRWKDSDLPVFTALNSDPRVMKYFPAPLSLEETQRFVQANEESFFRRNFGLWAAELKETGRFIGFVGISVPSFKAPFMPCVEIGWRLSYDYWGKGLATEGAKRVLELAFGELKLPEVVSFTTLGNLSSRRVMEKIGMIRDPREDFLHPRLEGHPLAPHVLYRLRNPRIL